MSEEDNSDEMVKVNAYVPSPHRMSLTCECNSDVNAVKCSLPLEFRWNVTPRDLEQIWLLSENVIECKYEWNLYNYILHKEHLSLGVYTTVEAYRQCINAQNTTVRYRGKAKNEKVTSSKESTKDNANTKPFDVHSEYLQLPEYTDDYNIERVRQIRSELNKLLTQSSLSSSSLSFASLPSRLLSPGYWGVHLSLPPFISRLSTTKRVTDKENTSKIHGESGNNDNKQRDYTNDDNEKYVVCIGFVTGRIGYASINVPCLTKADRSKPSNSNGAPINNLSTCKLSVNPTGYIGLVEVLPKMQKCGLGSIMLQTYVEFMTQKMPLHANTYLHYDIHRMELLIARCQQCTEPINANNNNNNNNNNNESKKENNINGSSNQESKPCIEKSVRLTAKSLVEADELCNLMDADALNPIMQYGVREVWLHCLAAEEKVVSFYKKNKFNECKICPNYYTYDKNKKNSLLMIYCPPTTNTNVTIAKNDGNEDILSKQTEIDNKESNDKDKVLMPEATNEMPLDVSSLLLKEEEQEKQKRESRIDANVMINKETSAKQEEKICKDIPESNDNKGSSNNNNCVSTSTRTRHFEWLTPSNYHLIDDVSISSTKKVRSKWLQQQSEQVSDNCDVANHNNISGAKKMLNRRADGGIRSSKDAIQGNTWKEWLLCANALFLLASVLYCCYMTFITPHNAAQVK